MKTRIRIKDYLHILLLTIGFFFSFNLAFAQPGLPERTMTVRATQAIHFGTICVGTGGGAVTLTCTGIRSTTGDVFLVPLAPIAQPAIFELKLCPGRNVTVSAIPPIILYNDEGGTLTLDIDPVTDKGNFYTGLVTATDCDFITAISVGGTLHVPVSPISGTYSGSFNMTFNQE